MTNGYTFYFQDGSTVMTFPITPAELSIKVGSNNKTVSLISEGDVNILKSPSLTELEFEARFPMRSYPYGRTPLSFQSYYDIIKSLKAEKKSFRFIVVRTTPNGNHTWDTNLLVSLESFNIKESANEGDDVLINFQLKQFKEYGVKTIKIVKTSSKPQAKSVNTTNRSTNNAPNANQTIYTVKSGDCLWNIAKKYYGNGAKWKTIYNTNKNAIEADAKKHGKASSSNGNWIWAGLKLTIPK